MQNQFPQPGQTLESEVNETQELFLMHCIHDNDYERLKKSEVKNTNLNFLIEYKDLSFDKKMSPLILASYLGRIECVKLMLENPYLDIDISTEDSGYTSLCVACLTGNYEVVKILLDGGAETNLPNKYNQTPMILCFSRLNEESNVYENTKICFKMVELLLDYGADINWVVDKSKGHTLLMQFCAVKLDLQEREKRLNVEVIKFLIEHGADKHMISNKEKDCVQLTEKHSNKEGVIEVLKNTNQLYYHYKSKKNAPVITIDKGKAQNALNIGKK